MLITVNDGDFECDSKEEVLSLIKKLPSEGGEMWISGGDKYPCLVILIKGSYAAVNYFEDENGGMWLSYNKYNDKEVTFTAGGEEWTPDAHAVVDTDTALACIDEFWNECKRPTCILWQEL